MDRPHDKPLRAYAERLSTALAHIDQFTAGATRLRTQAGGVHDSIAHLQHLLGAGRSECVAPSDAGEAFERALAQLQAQLRDMTAVFDRYLVRPAGDALQSEPGAEQSYALGQRAPRHVSVTLGYTATVNGQFGRAMRVAIGWAESS